MPTSDLDCAEYEMKLRSSVYLEFCSIICFERQKYNYILELLIYKDVGLLQVANILWKETIASSVSNSLSI